MLQILKKLFSTSFPDISRYESPKKCPTILYAVNLWLKPVSATGPGAKPPVSQTIKMTFLKGFRSIINVGLD